MVSAPRRLLPGLWTPADMPDQTGRTAVVTGANSGLGREIARRLAAAGADVVLACRNLEKAADARTWIERKAPGARVSVRELDLGDLASIERFADALRADHDRLDLLVNNAGLMAVDASTTADGFETQIGVNHLGAHALTLRLAPLLLATPGARIGAMSSAGHRPGVVLPDDLMLEHRGYGRWRAYFQSKLANLLFTLELQRRLEEAGSDAIAVAAHPGGTRTDLGTEGSSLANAVFRYGAWAYTQPPGIGAQPMLRAMTASDVRGGAFYGPLLLMVGPAVRETPTRAARDAQNARALWERSSELTGVGPELPRA